MVILVVFNHFIFLHEVYSIGLTFGEVVLSDNGKLLTIKLIHDQNFISM